MPYRGEERESYPGAKSRMLTGNLIVKVKDRFKDAVDLNIYDPRSPFWIWDVIRFSVKGGEPAWIVEGELLFKGVPSWEELEKALEDQIKKRKGVIK